MTSSPTSINSYLSGEDTSEDQLLPTSLAAKELQLALNRDAKGEELQDAISKCKELVLECDHLSPERKWLVRHLIELRLRLQECQEALLDPKHPHNKSSGASKRSVKGHHLILQPLQINPGHKYCDHCTGTIWHLVQAWYQCEDCGYSCHHKCISVHVRECAHVVASERGCYELDICPEVGLSAQQYKCYECKTPLPVSNNWTESDARRCDYTGLYYCSACHWGSSAIIPARVMHNWDFTPQQVCQASLQLLKITSNRPLINIQKTNPHLFTLVHELNLAKKNRYELNQMRKYLLACREAAKEHFLWKYSDTNHLIESPDLYSLQDLVDTNSGDLPTKLHSITLAFMTHIKVDCEVCKGRGHICEVCSNDEVLFPFDVGAHVCDVCGAVLHKVCYNRVNKGCPKCERLRKKREMETVYMYDDNDCD